MNTINTNTILQIKVRNKTEALARLANPTVEMLRYGSTRIFFPEYKIWEEEVKSDGNDWIPTGRTRNLRRVAELTKNEALHWGYPEDSLGEKHWEEVVQMVMNSLIF